MSPIKRSFPAVMFVFCLVSDISGETINQRQWEIDGDYYWRFTQEVSENHLYGISLFDECYALTLIIQQNEDEEERVYQVGTDPFWNRIVAGRLDYWVEAFGQWGSGPYEFKHPHGIERDLYGVIYVADTGNNRISAYRTDFEDASDPQLTHLWDIADDGSGNIKIPYGVSWDDNGSICYEDDDCLWVANTGNHEIIGYDLDYSGYGGYNNMWPQGVLTMPAFPYDNSGHPSGSFHFPKGVVRGRELWPTNYDNQSTNTDWLYVVDTGNERIVRLRYENTMSPGPTPEYFNEYRSDVHSDFTSATVDAFGDLYITDRFNHRIIKLNDRLQYLVEFGQAGTGQISGLLLSPTFMSTAFKSWYRPVWCPQWISYDTAILGEHWTSGSGGIQYGFGIDVLDLRTYNDYSLMRPACDWTLTSPGVYECRVFRTSDGALLKVFSGEVGNSGKVTVWWDRIDDSGCYHTESENLQFEITPIPFYEGIESGPTRTSPVLASVKTYYNDCGNNVCNQDENLVQGVRGNWGDTPAATYVGDASEIIYQFDNLDADWGHDIKVQYYDKNYEAPPPPVPPGGGNDELSRKVGKKGAGGETLFGLPDGNYVDQSLEIDGQIVLGPTRVTNIPMTYGWIQIPDETFTTDGSIDISIKKDGGTHGPLISQIWVRQHPWRTVDPSDPVGSPYGGGQQNDPSPRRGSTKLQSGPGERGVVFQIDFENGVILDPIPVGELPAGMACNMYDPYVQDSVFAVANSGSNSFSLIDPLTNDVIYDGSSFGDSPCALTFADDIEGLYIVNSGSDNVAHVDLTGDLTKLIPVGLNPVDIVSSPDGAVLYVCNGGDNSISVISTDSDSVISSYSISDSPQSLEITPDGLYLITTNPNANSLTIIETSNGMIVGEIATGSIFPQQAAFSATRMLVYVANYNSDNVTVINLSGTVEDTIPVGQNPSGLSMDPSEDILLVTNSGENTISRIDLESKTEIYPRISLGDINPTLVEIFGVSSSRGKDLNYDWDLVGENSSLPKAYSLNQNYPNPFNPSTTIEFDIPKTKYDKINVSLKIYSLRGRLVHTIVNEEMEPGRYKIHWNGRDDRDGKVSSGVYLYRIIAGDYIHTKKMVLLH